MNEKARLAQYVHQFKNWLNENNTPEEIAEDRVDSPSYPEWREIESFFTDLLATGAISNLDKEDQLNLLYLIARNWDIGSMIAWLSQRPVLSNLGDLSRGDFISLALVLVDQKDRAFDDAKSQFAASFSKWGVLDDEVEQILLRFHQEADTYTQRVALQSLAKLKYPAIRSLVEQSWQVDDEHYKITCLHIIDEYMGDKELLRQYLQKAMQSPGNYLADYVEALWQKT
jgi:hypothetical protein